MCSGTSEKVPKNKQVNDKICRDWLGQVTGNIGLERGLMRAIQSLYIPRESHKRVR